MHRVETCIRNKCMGLYGELSTASSRVFLSHKKIVNFIDNTSIAVKTTLHIPIQK